MTHDFEEIPEEEAPESLKNKWGREEFEEEIGGKQFLGCPHCGKPIEKKSFSCLYCGETILENSGPLGRLGTWIKRGHWWVVLVVGMIIFSFMALMVF